MLRSLRIENLVLIRDAELAFGAGLNAVTGETGAGKTMVVEAIDLLLGGVLSTPWDTPFDKPLGNEPQGD